MDVQETTAACRDAFAELASPACIHDPYPFMRWLREHDPVHRAASGLFLLSRHADIYWAFKATGDAFRGPAPGELARYFPRAATSLSLNLLASTLAMKEPPTHTRLRRLISRDFTMRQIDNLRPSIARIVAARLDGMAPALERGEAVDLHREFALALPMLVFAELFGMPQDDMFGLADGIGAILEGLSPHASDPQLAAADAASARVQAYFGDLIQRKRTDPRHDIVSMLVGAHDDDADTLSDAELISMLWGMLLGGFATTAATIDHAVLAMLAYPEQRHWLKGDAVGVKAFVEEVLRCDAPAMFSSIPRIAVRDIELGGVVIPKNADVRVLIAAGNRDPDAFADPDRFDPARFYSTSPGMSTDGKMMLSFGHGIHFCLGAQLARVQLAESLPRIQARFPTLTLAEQPTREPSAFLRTFRALSVRLHAQGGAEMRVVVDQDLCGTTGQCVLTLPGTFRQREPDGVAELCVATVPQALHAAVRLAASQCPVAAIRVIESDSGDGERASAYPAPSPAEAWRHAADTMGRFEGKVALVTGAGAGIGKACALAIAREGGRVVVADVDGSAAIACTAQIAAEAGHALALAMDIADAQAVAALFETAERHFGGVDLLVNNASAMHLTPRDHAILDLDLAVWDQIMATNLRGTLLCCRQAIPRMIARGGGAIVNMSSCQGLSGDTAQTSYAASKAAMNMLSASLATQYGHAQIRCNAVAPGLIMTERLLAKLDECMQRHLRRHQLLPRVGRPEDVAALVAFLLSDDAAFITGQVVCIDGGMLAHVPTYADGGNSSAARPAGDIAEAAAGPRC